MANIVPSLVAMGLFKGGSGSSEISFFRKWGIKLGLIKRKLPSKHEDLYEKMKEVK